MTVSSGFKSSGEKELKTDWPIEEGLEFGTEKAPEKIALEPEESFIEPDESRLFEN